MSKRWDGNALFEMGDVSLQISVDVGFVGSILSGPARITEFCP